MLPFSIVFLAPLLGVIKIYRYVISPLLGPSCRFAPTCSAYAEEAVMRFGVVRGGWLTLKRLLRCHPWAAWGYDPVPCYQKEELLPMDIISTFVEDLTVIDASYLCAERGMVGESWMVDVALSGRLDAQGMVMDFGHIKKKIKYALDHSLDHTLLVPGDAKSLSVRYIEDRIALAFQTERQGIIEVECPNIAVTLLPGHLVNEDGLKEIIIEKIKEVVPADVTHIEVNLHHEVIDGAYYHYTHGLKKHLGHCQRIAHGHRSKVMIWRNEVRDTALEMLWAKRFADIYIGTKEDVVRSFMREDVLYHHFVYHAQEGEYSLIMRADCCHLIDTDSTVECIAMHIAKTLKEESPLDGFKVKAYEGVRKGAVAIC